MLFLARMAQRCRESLRKHRDLVAVGGAVVILYVCLGVAMLGMASLSGVGTETAILGFAHSDSRIYVDLARMMIDEQRFAMTLESAPETFRTPGTPAFLALILLIWNSPIALIVGQIVVLAMTAVFIYIIGRRFFSPAIGSVAAALYTLDPMVMLKTLTVYTETLFVFALVAAIALFTQPRLSLRHAFIGGLLIGLLALVRPIGLFIAPIILLWVLWSHRGELRRAALTVAVAVLGLLLVTVPWMARNYAVAEHFSLSSIGTYNALFANVAEYEVWRTGKTKEAVWGEMLKRLDKNGVLGVHHDFVYSDAERALIFEYMEGKWVSYAFFHAFKTIPFFVSSSVSAAHLALYQQGVFTGEPPKDANMSAAILARDFGALAEATRENPVDVIEQVLWLCVWTLAALAILLVPRSLRPLAVFFWVIALAFAALTGPISMPPYRMPAEPFIFILASVAVQQLYRRFRASRAPEEA